MRVKSKRSLAVGLALAVGLVPLAGSGAKETSDPTLRVVTPEQVKERDAKKPPEEQAAVGTELQVPAGALPSAPGQRFGSEVDASHPPKMETPVPVPVPVPDSVVEALSAQASDHAIDGVTSESHVGFVARFEGRYRFGEETFVITVTEPTAKAKRRDLLLGSKSRGGGARPAFIGSSGSLNLAVKQAVVSVSGDGAPELKAAFLEHIEFE